MKGTDRVLAALAAQGVQPDVRRLADSALGCDVGAIASSLLFVAGEEPLLVMTSGAHRVDEDRVGALLGAPLRRASLEEVRRHTGFAVGGVAPVGHPAPLRTLVDEALAAHPVVWAAAGHPHAVFATTYAQLVTLTAGSPAVVGD